MGKSTIPRECLVIVGNKDGHRGKGWKIVGKGEIACENVSYPGEMAYNGDWRENRGKS